jgi:hypothetical protein
MVALLVTAAHTQSPSGARVGAVVFAVFGLALLLLTGYLWRRGHPRQARYIRLQVEPLEIRRGQSVTATLVILDAERLGESLELGLVCTEFYDARERVYTQSGSYTRRATRSVDAFKSWSHPDRHQARQTVSLEVPASGLFSYEGSAVSWAWRVSVRDRHPHRADAHRDVPIWVSP